jgi:hypothetical protein
MPPVTDLLTFMAYAHLENYGIYCSSAPIYRKVAGRRYLPFRPVVANFHPGTGLIIFFL